MTEDESSTATRRNILAGAAALLAGCSGEDDGDATQTRTATTTVRTSGSPTETPEPDVQIDMEEQPFNYILAPDVMTERGLIEGSADTGGNDQGQGSALYIDYQSMWNSLDDRARTRFSREIYPRVMISIKGFQEGDDEDEFRFDDIRSYVGGKTNDGLIETDVGREERATQMQDAGFSQLREKDGWEIFDGTYDVGQTTSDMRAALHDNYIAYVINDPGRQDDENSKLQDLDRFIDTYVEMLMKDSSLSFSSRNEYGQKAEDVYRTLGERDWDMVSQSTIAGEISSYDAEAGETVPLAASISVVDFEGQNQIVRNYNIFENGNEEASEPQTYDLVTEQGGSNES